MKSYFASCPKRSEEWLIEELTEFGAQEIEKRNGGVQFKASTQNALEILFQTRIASRLYLLLDVYPIRNEDDLYNKVSNKWWHKVFDNHLTFKIQTLFDRDANSYFKNSMHFSLKVKDAIVDSFRKETGKRPSIDTKYPDISLLVRVESKGKTPGFNAKFFLDLTGTPLSDRGYRRGKHQAPLRENLAATLVHISKWSPENGPLHDIFCGSGTILIEAALKAFDLPPTFLKIKKAQKGRKGDFSFLNQKWFLEDKEIQNWVEDYFHSVVSKANEVKNSTSDNIFGSDLDISIARENIKAAGLEGHIKLIQSDFDSFLSEGKRENLTIVSNPPYGERLEGAQELYYQLGQALKDGLRDSNAFIITGDEELRKKIHLKPKQKYPLFNGPIDCRLCHYEIE